jgi:hypothetical protein
MLAEMGSPDCGDSLVLDTEVIAMWFWPLTITLRIRKTRNGWSATLRVNLIY